MSEKMPAPRPWSEIQKPERPRNTERSSMTRLTTVIGLAGAMLTADTTPTNIGEDELGGTRDKAVAEEQLKNIRQKAEQCDLLDPEARVREGLKTPGRLAFNRHKILRYLAEVGSCTDPTAEIFNQPEVCNAITEGINKNKRGFHPILKPFYTMLYDDMRCRESDQPSSAPAEVRTALQTLSQTTDEHIISKYPLLDNELAISEACRPALEIVDKNQADIRALASYLVASKSKFEAYPTLHAGLERATEKHGEDNLESAAITAIGRAVTAAGWSWLVCRAPIEKVASTLGIPVEDINQRRREVFPVIREIADLISKDETPEGEQAAHTFFRLTKAVSEAYPK